MSSTEKPCTEKPYYLSVLVQKKLSTRDTFELHKKLFDAALLSKLLNNIDEKELRRCRKMNKVNKKKKRKKQRKNRRDSQKNEHKRHLAEAHVEGLEKRAQEAKKEPGRFSEEDACISYGVGSSRGNGETGLESLHLKEMRESCVEWTACN